MTVFFSGKEGCVSPDKSGKNDDWSEEGPLLDSMHVTMKHTIIFASFE